MIDSDRKRVLGLFASATVLMVLLCSSPAEAVFISPKLGFAGLFGREVNLTEVKANAGLMPELEDVCTVVSGDECQKGKASSIQGGFKFDEGVAVGPEPNDYVYVAEEGNRRVQVFTQAGAFVSMFGWDVNETKSNESSATQEQKNVCTEAEITATPKVTCRAGQFESKGAAGVISKAESVAVDQLSGNVYVLDVGAHRVEEYTPSGAFVLMIGKKVNLNGSNLCTSSESAECQIGEASATGSTEHAAFKPVTLEAGNLLVVGGPKDLLYVGDEERIQEFESSGKWVSDVSLKSLAAGGKVHALGIDPAGYLYVVYYVPGGPSGIYVLSPNGDQERQIDENGKVKALSLDPFGRLGLLDATPSPHGALYEAATGKLLGEFKSPIGLKATDGMAFNTKGELYLADWGNQAIETFRLIPVADVITRPAANPTDSNVTLNGEINPENVSETEGWFEWGVSEALGSTTQRQAVAGAMATPISEGLVGLRPNQKYYFRLAVEDKNEKAPEPPLVGETLSFTTEPLPPAVEGQPSAFDVTFSSAVLSASVNPENAKTEYRFQYGACESLSSCVARQETTALDSSAYGAVGAAQTASGLQPSTTYHYRLVAVNETLSGTKETTLGQEGSFTTAPAPGLSASTSPVSAVTATSATLSGVAEPDGAGATYAFQVGVDSGPGTVFTAVVQGPTGSSGPVSESFTLNDLQPSTTYAYRLVVSSAYGTAEGSAVIFTTAGLPTVLYPPAPLAMLSVPHIAFPHAAKGASRTVGCKRGHRHDRHRGCAQAKKHKARAKAKRKARHHR